MGAASNAADDLPARDTVVSRFVVDTTDHENIDLAIAVRQEVHAGFVEAGRQRALRIEAIRYQADLAPPSSSQTSGQPIAGQ